MNIALNLLGYEANTTDSQAVDAARQFLVDHAANVFEVAPDTGQDLLVSGQVDIAIEYSGDIFQIINDCACDTYAYAIPDEGALIWIDNLAVPKGAPNQHLAEVFIDYLLQPQVSADISNYTAYASPNRIAIAEGLIDSASLDNPAIYPDEARLERLFFNIPTSEIEQQYGAAWDAVRAAIGR
jgi:spermidine/putrescine transport system substrate-binding protein